jgi:hypothetical protein
MVMGPLDHLKDLNYPPITEVIDNSDPLLFYSRHTFKQSATVYYEDV